MSVQELKPDYTMFLDKTTVLYGASGSGKSFLMRDILHMLQPHIQQVIVISPTDAQNSSYSGIIPKPCIHYAISEQHLNDIYERQMMLTTVCKKASNEDIIYKLYSMIPSGKRAVCDDALRSVNDRLRALKTSDSADVSKAEAECKKFRVAMWKHVIGQNLRMLYILPLTADQKMALEYMNVNPKMVIIFDDCTEQLDKLKKSPVIQSLFYKGRWAQLTILIGCHTDKTIDAGVKKSTFVSIFTEEGAARAYFNRASSDFDRATKNKAIKAIDHIFTTGTHQKLVILRGDHTFYKYTAVGQSDFRFGSESLWNFCDRVKSDEGTLSATNKFIRDFQH
jgi:energy-coupling factor transporter ATP-binding protein EcfA2